MPSRGRASIGVGVMDADGQKRKPVFSTSPEVVGSLRNRVTTAANTIWGMKAIFETEDAEEDSEEETGDGGLV